MEIHHNVSLSSYNTFGIEASARQFAEVTSVKVVADFLRTHPLKKEDLMVLGGGSNILLTGNLNLLVLKNSLKGIEKISEDDNHVYLKIMGGEVWHELVLYAIQHNYAGIENLSLIPGLMGAAPMQNIGAYGVELESVFESLEAVHLENGEIHYFNKADCGFGYRESVFKKHLKGQYLIASVTLRLNKRPDFNISYGAIRQTLDAMNVEDLNIKAISDAVIHIRQSKLPDPNVLGNAGSFFKNPEVEQTDFKRLIAQHPNMPNYPLVNGKVKIPAGWLIEQAGWKGKRVGNTGAHKKQALVLVNYGNASGQEIKTLAFDIRDSVHQQFGILLNPEVNII